MTDRPGSLAVLARHCGERDVNILGLQIFPGIGGVTDELVLRCPDGWGIREVAELVEGAGGVGVSVGPCTEHALVDGPTQHLQALRRVAHEPAALPAVLARLLDAEPAPEPGWPDPGLGAVQDSIRVAVGERSVELRRTAPFTATEHARAAAFAEIAAELVASSDVAQAPAPGAGAAPGQVGGAAPGQVAVADPTTPGSRVRPVIRPGSEQDVDAVVRMHGRCSTDSVLSRYGTPLATVDERFVRRLLAGPGETLLVHVEGEAVAMACLSACVEDVVEVSLLVEDGWHRRGLGTRLLSSAARLARSRGAGEVVLRSRTHNPALTALAFASGLRARLRREGDTVVVGIGVAGLKPLTTAPTTPTAPTAPTAPTPPTARTVRGPVVR